MKSMKIIFNENVINKCLLNASWAKNILNLEINFIVLICLILIGCETNDPLTQEERMWLKQHDGKIIINNDAGWPPIVDKDNDGKLFGIAMEYQRLLERKLNFRFQFCEFDSWENNMQKFRNGEIDAHSNLHRTPDRTKFALFTKPYIEIPNAIIVRKEIQDSLTLDKMQEMKIAVTKNYAIHKYIKQNYKNLELIPLDEDIQCLVETSTKSVDAAVVNLAVASFLIEKQGITNLRVAGYSKYKNALSFASRKDLPILNRILDKGLNVITQKERDAIYKKWISLGPGYSPFYESKQFWIVIGSIIGSTLILILFILIWNKSLKREVKLRTENLNLANKQLQDEIAIREKAERELRDSKQFNEAILNSSPNIIYVYDIELKVNIYSNEGIMRVLGYSVMELKDMGERMIEILMYPDDFEIYVNETLPKYHSVQGNDFIEHEYRMKHKNGHWCWLFSKESIFHRKEDGSPKQIFGIISDITDKKQAEQEALILKTAVNQVPVGIALADENINIYYCNPAGLGMRGGDIVDLIEIPKDAFNNWQVLMSNGEAYEIENLPLVRAIKNGKTIREEFIVRHQDGSDHICDAIACPIYEKTKIIGGMVVFLDISEK